MKIVLIGSGNVATHLGRALQAAGHAVLQVWSRQLANASTLGSILGCDVTDRLDQLDPAADLYVLSVSDNAIPLISEQFPYKDKLLVHTSGATSLNAITSASLRTGVFYPLQTFSKEKEVDFRRIPIAIEGDTAETTEVLLRLAQDISHWAEVISSEQRKVIHIAAVFACNFSNLLYSIGEEILAHEGLSFDLLRPLIAETAEKAAHYSPLEVQTGPARRRDSETIGRHLDYLRGNEELSSIYRLLTEAIVSRYKGNDSSEDQHSQGRRDVYNGQ